MKNKDSGREKKPWKQDDEEGSMDERTGVWRDGCGVADIGKDARKRANWPGQSHLHSIHI
jgi:hypothetical protein